VVRYERLLDARNSLSHLGEFVNAAIACFDQNVTCGTYNLTNGGSITTREVVELVKATGIYDQDFQFFESESEFMQQAARTPRSNCVLDNSKALAAGLKLSPVHDRIERSLAEWVPEC
jgi:dTDP-4-dehydrorhamnose reductase